MISKQLVTLKDDVPVKNKIEDFVIKDIKKDKLYNFLREMEFNRLLSQAINFYGEPSEKKQNEDFLKEKIDVTKYKTILTEEDLNKWINILKTQSLIAVDTETSSLSPVEADLVGISFVMKKGKACYIPLKNQNHKCLNSSDVLKKSNQY